MWVRERNARRWYVCVILTPTRLMRATRSNTHCIVMWCAMLACCCDFGLFIKHAFLRQHILTHLYSAFLTFILSDAVDGRISCAKVCKGELRYAFSRTSCMLHNIYWRVWVCVCVIVLVWLHICFCVYIIPCSQSPFWMGTALDAIGRPCARLYTTY